MQADEIQREMRHVRTNLGTDVRNLAQRARETTDWRHYVRRYPWVCLGAVAATGYLLVPRKIATSAAGAAEASRRGQSTPMAAGSTAGSVAGLTSAVTAMVVRAVASALVQRGMDFMNHRKAAASAAAERQDENAAGFPGEFGKRHSTD